MPPRGYDRPIDPTIGLKSIKSSLVATAIGAALAAIPVHSQEASADKAFNAKYVKADTNNDERIERERARANEISPRNFDSLGTDSDDFISKAKMDAARAEAAKPNK
jgi:hypothetical protein